jgi:hypothetical protein
MCPRGQLHFCLPVIILASLPSVSHAQGSPIDFNREVRPILSNNCFQCHGPDEKVRKGKLRLDTKEGTLATVVVPEFPDSTHTSKR